MDVSDRGGVPPARIRGEQRVTPLELFFDLAFVFALTQVTGFLSTHLRWLERVMNLGKNRIEMRISRSAWFPRDLRFPHS